MNSIFDILAIIFTAFLLLFIIAGQAHEIKDLKYKINVMQNDVELSCKSYCKIEFEKMGC